MCRQYFLLLALLFILSQQQAFADGSAPTTSELETKINQLQQEIDVLKAKESQQQTSNIYSQNKNTKQGKRYKRHLTNMAQIQNYLLSDLSPKTIPLGMLPSSQLALGMLKQRNHYPDRALVVGGVLESDMQAWSGSKVVYEDPDTNKTAYYQSGRGIYLTQASLFAAANLGHYVTTEVNLLGDQNNAPIINEAVALFGNLQESPFYAMVGKSAFPFGTFAGGGVWTPSLGQMLFSPYYVTNLELGYSHYGVNSTLTAFQTDDQSSNFAYAIFYKKATKNYNYGVNVGYLYNVNGSGNTTFDAITNPSIGNKTRIGALDAEYALGYKAVSLSMGVAEATDKSTLTNNGYAGAWYAQLALSPTLWGRETDFSLAYNGAYNSNNLPVILSGSAVNEYTTTPELNANNAVELSGTGANKLVIGSIQRPFFTTDVLLGLEYAYMHFYNHGHTNTYTLDLSVYF
ncbi:DUF3573 domain-containing protein [Fangia hongkongensis]|nr:DUF3573 domain-containing protein [Fangia hongkongensis]